MPELPDLTVYNKNLSILFLNTKLDSVTVYKTKRLNVPAETLSSALEGATLTNMEREGKEIRFSFSSGHSLSVHLMLKGGFEVTDDDAGVANKRLSLKFDQRGFLIVCDQQGWATFTLDAERSQVPDALSSQVDAKYLRERLQATPKTTMKGFLIDQTVLRGIGNAYADEILWDCRISPLSECGSIPDEAIKHLSDSIKSVLTSAVDSIETVAADAINGEHRDFLKVHNRSKTHSPTGFAIKQELIATKETFFTDEQVLY